MTDAVEKLEIAGSEEARQIVPAPGVALARGYGGYNQFTGAQPSSAESFFIAFHEYVRVLRRFKWVILAIVLASVAIGTVRTLMTTRLYTATVRLQIDRSASKVIENGNISPVETGDFEFLRTQYELLQSRGIAERAVAALKLADDPEFSKPVATSFFTSISQRIFGGKTDPSAVNRAALERGIAGLILSNRLVRPISGSRLVDLSYTDTSPVRAQAVTMGLADAFINSTLDKRFQANAYAKAFLEDQLKQLQIRLQDSEKILLDFGQKEQILATTEKSSISENNLAAANVSLGTIVAERIKNEQLYKQVETATGASLPQFLSNPALEGLREKRNALVTEYQQNIQTLKPNYPTMIEINNKIKETDRQLGVEIKTIKASLKGAYDASVAQENEMKSRIEALRAEVLDLQKRSIQYNILKREADSNRALYDSLLQRYKEVDVAGGIGANNIFIIDKAEVPRSPSSPNVTNNIVLSLIIGLILGLVVAIVLERLDNTVTTMDEIERLTGLATLGVIPKLSLDKNVQDELADVRSGLSEAYRTLCTSLQFSTDNGLPKSILFTSADAAEGKSTSALTVARHFANIGLKVLLIDCDLRKPSLHVKMGLDNSKGLTNYLTGSCTASEAGQSTSISNLSFIASGPLPPNASDLLASPRFVSLLSMAGDVFNLIIIDGPPVMGLADAQLLSAACAATTFVVSSGGSSKHAIRQALKRLQFARGNVIGTVLTRYEAKNESYAYGYGYGYGYGGYGGYGYGHDEAIAANVTPPAPKLVSTL